MSNSETGVREAYLSLISSLNVLKVVYTERHTLWYTPKGTPPWYTRLCTAPVVYPPMYSIRGIPGHVHPHGIPGHVHPPWYTRHGTLLGIPPWYHPRYTHHGTTLGIPTMVHPTLPGTPYHHPGVHPLPATLCSSGGCPATKPWAQFSD